METYDDYGQPDIFSNLTNPEHALQSPNALLLSASQNIFMYEQEYNNTSSTKQEPALSKVPRLNLSDNIFEFPNPEEMAELGCSPAVDNCWPDTPLLGRSLDGSLNDSGVCFSWDLSEDDQEGLFPIEASPFCSAPTLAELNLEDSQSVDNSMTLKRKADNHSIQSNMNQLGQQEMSLSPHSWKRVKTEAVEMANVEKRTKTPDVPKLSSPRPGLSRKSSKTKPSRPLMPKNGRTHNETSKVPADAKKSVLSLQKVHPSKIDFTELFWKRYRSRETIPSPTKEMSRSELLARTPNPFGNRRFLGRNALLKAKTQHHLPAAKVAQTSKSVARTVKPRTNHRTKRPTLVQKKSRNVMPLLPSASEDSSQDRLWTDLKVFMYGEHESKRNKKKETPHRTLLPEPDMKSESSKSPRTNMRSDPGLDSHDEGLGSENEDHDDDFGSDDDDDDDDDDIPDDTSDISDDPGLPSTSTKHSAKDSTGSLAIRRRRVKTRRSEYDDFTPNPRKLLNIGHELNKLNLTISSLCPGNEASNDEKNQTRREKNKLASRACRLKKKAQHEANKVKHWGLIEEAKQLKLVLGNMRKEMTTRLERPKASWDYSLGAKLDHLIKNSLGHMVAGHTSEFVNSILEKTAKGIPISQLKPKKT